MESNAGSEKFYNNLRDIVKDKDLMPFVCNGNPLNSSIVIIGFNPTTTYNFWKFFSSTTGFESVAEFEAYKEQRNNAKKSEISITRKKIRRLEQTILHIHPDITILKMNLYAKATKREKDLPREDHDLEIFNFLIKSLRPKVIIAHGSKVSHYLKGMNLGTPEFSHLSSVPIIYGKHFAARGYSYEQIDALAKQVLEKIG